MEIPASLQICDVSEGLPEVPFIRCPICEHLSVFLQIGHAVRKPGLGWEFPNIADPVATFEDKPCVLQGKGQQFMALCHIWQIFWRKWQSPAGFLPICGVMEGAAVLYLDRYRARRGRSRVPFFLCIT